MATESPSWAQWLIADHAAHAKETTQMHERELPICGGGYVTNSSEDHRAHVFLEGHPDVHDIVSAERIASRVAHNIEHGIGDLRVFRYRVSCRQRRNTYTVLVQNSDTGAWMVSFSINLQP